jgi:hypothetical protein
MDPAEIRQEPHLRVVQFVQHLFIDMNDGAGQCPQPGLSVHASRTHFRAEGPRKAVAGYRATLLLTVLVSKLRIILVDLCSLKF